MFPGSWHGSRGCGLDGAEREVFDHVRERPNLWVTELQPFLEPNTAEMIHSVIK